MADMNGVVQQLQAVNDKLTAQNQQNETAEQRNARQQAIVLENCRKACASMPRYNRQKPWRSWTVEYLTWYRLHGIERAGEEFAKRALINACTGEAADMVAPFSEGTQAWNDHPNCWPIQADPAAAPPVPYQPGYQSVLTTLFAPSSESELAKTEFGAYKQRAKEDISSYISKKTALYKIAYGDEGAFSILCEKLIDGIYSNVVKRQVRRAQPQDEVALRQACVENVAIERSTFLKGYSESTSLAGLESTTRTHSSEPHSDKMEVSEINLEGNDEDEDIQAMGNSKCFNCQKIGHYARDCRAPRRNNGNYPNTGGRGGGKNSGNIQAVGGDHRNYVCHTCHKRGHISKNCFQNRNGQRGRGGRGGAGRGNGSRGAARGRGGRGGRGAARGRGRGGVREVQEEADEPAEETEEYQEQEDTSFLEQIY